MRTTYSLLLWFILLPFLHSQQWESVSPPLDFITDHSFGFAIDGKGYLVTGTSESFGPTNTFMQYDPDTDSWTVLDTFPGAARGYAIGDIWDRKAYLGFGTSTSALLQDLWVYDPDAGQWSELAPCPCEPRLHPAMIAHNGKVFVGLGNNNNGNLNDWWEYDIATDTWSQKPDFPGARRHHPYQFGVGDYVYTGLGHGAGIFKEWYRYDPVAETWTQVADIPGEGRVAGTQFSYNGKGYVLSGDGDDHSSMETGEFWQYDPELDTWDSLPPHPGKSRWAPASFVIEGVVYLFNGTSYFQGPGNVYQTDAYKFDLKEMVSGTSAPDPQVGFIIYPHPFSSELFIHSPLGIYDEINIFSSDHKLVYRNGPLPQHDVSHLPAGIYMVQVRSQSGDHSVWGVKY